MIRSILLPVAGALSAASLLAACHSSTPPNGSANPPTIAPVTGPSRCGDVQQRPWCDTALSPQERSDLLLAQMTLTQKLSLLAGDDILGVATGEPATGTSDGIPELGIPNLFMSDGPVGTREGKATAMPAPIALGASFNPELSRRVGNAIAIEVRAKGNDLVHAPVVDVVRQPLAGRTFETYGEDPFLAARLGVEWVRGAQSQGVIANVKHYAMNTQEGQIGVPPLTAVLGGRQLVNAVVDERTLRELYLSPFEATVKEADVGTVMCAYTQVNGEPACGNFHLLQEVLRDDWGFDGFVLTDYILSSKATAQSVNNGVEIEMPIGVFHAPLLLQLAVISGQISEATVDTRIGNILRTLFRFGFFDRADFPNDDSLIDQAAHADIAREVEEQGTVLLRNQQNILPLNTATLSSLAIIGEASDSYYDVGGSASVDPFRFISPRQAITERAGAGVQVTYDAGTDAAAAAAIAAAADVTLVFVRDKAQEGVDKTCLGLDCPPLFLTPIGGSTPQDDLIVAVAAANPNTIVIMETGGTILTPWRENIAGLLSAWYPGQEVGPALARILFGDVEPGGRLPLSLPASSDDTPTANNLARYPGLANQALYSEGVFTGYRWHDQNNVEPAYPFGFGLSYTQFEYRDLAVSGTLDQAQVALTLVNTGARAGSDVVQVYVAPPADSPVAQPPQWLRGFQKVTLAAGESERVSIPLGPRSFQYWDVVSDGWVTAPGCHEVRVSSSSRDVRLSDATTLCSES